MILLSTTTTITNMTAADTQTCRPIFAAAHTTTPTTANTLATPLPDNTNTITATRDINNTMTSGSRCVEP